MIKEFQAFFTVFKKGKEVADPAKWKNWQIMGNTLAALLSALLVIAGGFDYNFDINEQQMNAIGLGIAAIYGAVNTIITVVTSKKVGVGEDE